MNQAHSVLENAGRRESTKPSLPGGRRFCRGSPLFGRASFRSFNPNLAITGERQPLTFAFASDTVALLLNNCKKSFLFPSNEELIRHVYILSCRTRWQFASFAGSATGSRDLWLRRPHTRTTSRRGGPRNPSSPREAKRIGAGRCDGWRNAARLLADRHG